ncbi:MAG TPA: ankyrin repeat domain-containing protein, partial [Rectinema sp.]|nr:ankyrin repeat domain-containing protein [Rectinema sp.]
LFDLVIAGTPEQVQAAIKSGAQVNDSDTLGQTPLMHGAECNDNSDVITTLLNAGADAKAKSIEGKTAFDYAQNNPTIKGTKAYWELNNARF